MAKKNNKSAAMNKSVNDMTDSEFIAYADYLSSPYYQAYMNAHAQAGNPYGNDSYGGYGMQSEPKNEPALNKKQKKNIREKKRAFFLILIAIFMLVIVALAVLTFIDVAAVAGYAGIYKIPGVTSDYDVNIMLVDPAIGLVKSFVNLDGFDSEFGSRFFGSKLEGADVATKIALYAVPIGAALVAICAVIGLLKALGALLSGRKKKGAYKGYYKKFRFGFLGFVTFLCGLILTVGGVFCAGLDLQGATDFILFKSQSLQAGYGLYAVVILPVLVMLCSGLAYKKTAKKPVNKPAKKK